jgi:hypothetical protein
MVGNETMAERVARIASKGLFDPQELTPDEIRTLCASALKLARDEVPNGAVAMDSFDAHLRDALIGGL